MTDIRRHLPMILSSIRRHLSIPSEQARQQIRADLSTLLPNSYGVGTGRLLYHEQLSSLLDIIIYDKTISIDQPAAEDGLYDLRQVLLIAQIKHTLDIVELDAALAGITSAKVLRPQTQNLSAQAKGGSKISIGKLTPIGVVAFHRLIRAQDDGPERVSMVIDTALKRHAEPLRADYLIAQAHALSYTNPLLEGSSFEATTMNITHEPAYTKQHHCYVCKQIFTRRHFFYAQLCIRCGDFNYQKRAISTSLTGRTALVTGARVKIGYATSLRLLRAGACVIATTRFPHDAARRYSQEADFAEWRDRLHIYGLDLRHLPALEHFIDHLHTTYPILDILINNAAQTVKRPAAYYNHLLAHEQTPLLTLPPEQQPLLTHFHALSEHAQHLIQVGEAVGSKQQQVLLLPTDEVSGQNYVQGQVLRQQNSWTHRIDEVDLTEMLEVQVINVTAPFLLISRLRHLLRKSPFPQRFIINVSAVEGQFAQSKSGVHPHTNMAKAALNMLTYSAANDLAQDNLFINSVDPGFVSRQLLLEFLDGDEQIPPLDMIDAAARICDPIFQAIRTGQPEYGNFYKNYQPASW